MKETFERIIKTRPPFDKRDSDPTKNYGIGSMVIWFYLKGEKGIIQFQMNTGAYLKDVAAGLSEDFKRLCCLGVSRRVGFRIP